jgi:hypothetical protein
MTSQIMKKNCNGPVYRSGKRPTWRAANRVSSIQFGVEMAFLSHKVKPFCFLGVHRGAKSIQINGLVWMGEAALKQTEEEISARICL